MRIRTRHLAIPGILAFFFIVSSINVVAPPNNNFAATFEVMHQSPWGVTIRACVENLQDVNDDFAFKMLLNNTNVDLTKLTVGMQEERFVDVEVIDYAEECRPYMLEANETTYEIPNCTKVVAGSHIEQRFDLVERKLMIENKDGTELRNQWEEVHIKKQEIKCYRVHYRFNERTYGSYGYTYLDIKGVLFYDFTDSSWWDDVTYGYGYEVESTATEAGIPIALNDTDGVGTGNTMIWTNNESTDQQWLVSVGTGVTGAIAVGNTTDEAFWENATSMTGNNPQSVWADFLFSYHGENITMNDSTANNIIATVEGNPTASAAVFGNGIDFDGTGDAYQIPALGAIFDGEYTIDFWFYPTVSERAMPLSFEGDKKIFFQFDQIAVDALDLTYNAANLLCNEATTLGTWNHVGFIVNDSGSDAYLYMNGTLCGSTETFAADDKATANYIGAYASGSLEFDGMLDEVRMSPKDLGEGYIFATNNSGRNNLARLAAETTPASVVLRTLKPDNITYSTTSIIINGTAGNPSNITWSEDGGANQTACNNCTGFENTTTLAEGTHDIFVYGVLATDSSTVDSNQTFFTIDITPPTVVVVDPTGTNQTNATIPLNFNATDTVSPIGVCTYSLNNFGNVTIAGCANTSFAVTQAGTYDITVYVNDTGGALGEDTSTFSYFPLQNFTANNSMDGDQIQDFRVLIIEPAVDVTTTNGTAPVLTNAIGFGTWTVRFIAGGYNTTDFPVTFTNESLLTENFTLVPASVNITVLDEVDYALGVTTNITFNVTISNATQSNTWYNEVDFFQYTNSTPTGSVTVSISSYGYQPREFYLTINENIANDFTAFMLKSTDALYVRFHVLTVEGLGISGAEVSADRLINGSWYLIEEQTADDAGIAGLSLAPFASYRVTASATGYVTQIQTIVPSASDYYFYMGTTGNVSYHFLFEDISFWITPQDPSLQNNVAYDFMFNITSSNSSLEWFSMNLTYNDTMQDFFLNVSGSAAGGNITFELVNVTNTTGNYTMEVKFKKEDYGEWTGHYYYTIRHYETRVGSLWYFLQQFAASDAPAMFKHLIAIFTAFMAAGVASRMGMRGGGVLAGVVLIGWTLAGWFSWNLMLLSILSVLAVYALKEGI